MTEIAAKVKAMARILSSTWAIKLLLVDDFTEISDAITDPSVRNIEQTRREESGVTGEESGARVYLMLAIGKAHKRTKT